VDTRLGASFHSTAQWMRRRVAHDMRSPRLPHPVRAGRREMLAQQRSATYSHAVIVHSSVASKTTDGSWLK